MLMAELTSVADVQAVGLDGLYRTRWLHAVAAGSEKCQHLVYNLHHWSMSLESDPSRFTIDGKREVRAGRGMSKRRHR